MTADTSAATMHSSSTTTSNLMIDTSSPPNQPPTTIFWQPCLSLNRLPCKITTATAVPSFVYPHPKHSSPTIVGVAVKRTLKSPDATQCSTITITDKSSNHHTNECTEIKQRSIHLNTSATNNIDNKSIKKPQVISDSDLIDPLKDLFLRKLHEKDVAHIGERMKCNILEETMVLLSGKTGCMGTPNVTDNTVRITDTTKDTFRLTKPDHTPQQDEASEKTTTTIPSKSTPMTTSHKHIKSDDALSVLLLQPTCVLTPSESKITNSNGNIAVFSSPWSVAIGADGDDNNSSSNDGNCNDDERTANNNTECIPHLLTGSTRSNDTLNVHSKTSATSCKCLEGGDENDTTYYVRNPNERMRFHDDVNIPKSVTASKSVQRTHPTRGDTLNEVAPSATIDSLARHSTLMLYNSATIDDPTNPESIVCNACACHPSPPSTTTKPTTQTIHSSIQPEVNDVTTHGSKIHNEAIDVQRNHQPSSISSCCSIATPLLPAAALLDGFSITNNTKQQPSSRATPSGTQIVTASTEWAENLLAKLKQEHRIKVANRSEAPQQRPKPLPPDADINSNIINKNNNNTNHHNTNNNHNLGHSQPNHSAPTPTHPELTTTECEQENGCHIVDERRPDDAVVDNHERCHPDDNLLVQLSPTDYHQVTSTKCCSHQHTQSCSTTQSDTRNLRATIEQIQAIYAQSDISDSEVDDELSGVNRTHPENQQNEDLCVSPGSDSFEASNRLRRLENRFRDLAFTKKLLVNPLIQTITPIECPASSAVAEDSIQPSSSTTTTSASSSTRDNISSARHSKEHHDLATRSRCLNCCESVSSDAVRVRSAIDLATSYCLPPSGTELGIPSAPHHYHHPQTTQATPNTVAVVDASSSHLVRSECKHNHRQQRSHSLSSSSRDIQAAPTPWRRTNEEQVHIRANEQGITGDIIEEEQAEEDSTNKVENETTIQLQSRVSTPKPDTKSICSHQPHQPTHLAGDDFIEPDLIRFDDDPLCLCNANTSLTIAGENPLSTDDSESEEVSYLFPDNNKPTKPSIRPLPPLPPPSPQSPTKASVTNLLHGDLHTQCEFDVRHLAQYYPQVGQVFECYDELIDSDSESSSTTSADEDTAEEFSDSNQSCDCSLETIPLLLSHTVASSTPNPSNDNTLTLSCSDSISAFDMRDSGTLRGLLKKPNRPPPTHKNRVVFDETQNKFFDADYIILIREDCPYDEEDEEPCTCGEHELVRLCCEDGCQCQAYSGAADGATDNTRTPQSPKFAPPIEFVDPAALSPPEGYKDGGKLANTLGNALGGHVFGAQHMQQLQVIQRLQAQRAAMLAARATNGQAAPPSSTTAGSAGQPQLVPATTGAVSSAAQQQQQGNNGSLQQQQTMMDASNVCTECAECAECAAKQLQDCSSPCSDDGEPKLDNVPLVALAPIQTSSPERRIIAQKEIIAGEERPRYLLINNQQPSQSQPSQQEMPDPQKRLAYKAQPPLPIKGTPLVSQRYVVETITMTTVTERRVVREATTDTHTITNTNANTKSVPAAPSNAEAVPAVQTEAAKAKPATDDVPVSSQPGIDRSAYLNSAGKPPTNLSTAAQISGILKGGKLWKSEPSQSDDSTNITSDDESSKRSVRFTDNTKETSAEHNSNDRELCDGESQKELDEDDDTVSEPIEPMLPPKKHTSIFHNALRPNSAVRQLFPATVGQPAAALTHEALRAFEEAKRSHVSAPIVHSDSETDTIRRTIERNALRRSLIKKKQQRTDNSLEERIRRLTCDVDDNLNNSESSDSNQDGCNMETLERRDSPAGEENPQQPKYGMDKSFSPSSSASSSSSGSTSAYRKITDIFNRDRRQERIPEADENPIVIIPQMQECRCPAAPDLGMGVQMPAAHTQVHQTPPRQTEARRQFLSTLAPLTSCVAGQRDDFSSYYTLAPGERASTASSQYSEYSLGDIDAVLKTTDEAKKVAPDVIAGTPGQEFDELANFAQQEAVRTERLKKRYSAETSASAPNSNAGSDDDEQNDYGFNKRPSVRGIKPRFSSTNEILQQMQAQLSTPTHPQGQVQTQTAQVAHQVQSNTLPKNHSYMLQKSTPVQPQQPQQSQQLQHHHSQHIHQQQVQQVPNAAAASVVNQSTMVNQTHQQQIAAWNFYHEHQQRNAAAGYYQTLPLQARHSFHGHEEATVYQNCQTVAMEQHFNRAYARSPTRRPESPPPLRNYHQTMVLIPYNTESYAHFSSNEQQVPGVVGQQFQRHNVLEYQQVTQQTIRVPMGYPLPGMQLHVVANRNQSTAASATNAGSVGNAGATQYAQYAQHQNAARGYAYSVTEKQSGSKFIERGVPEGAASAPHNDTLMSPTAGGGQNQSSVATSSAAAGAVFYAMNV